MNTSSGCYSKLNNWIETLYKIPIGNYKNIPINSKDSVLDISNYLEKVKKNIDLSIYGHKETKEQIIRILAQWISNKNGSGYVIGIKGPPGVGKTKLVKECLCKAMDFPLAFISLGGIEDSSYLNGFNYTYEGSTHGKIVDCLIKSRIMNPVFLFDELDKISTTSRGEEIVNSLIHLTDPIQNDKYTDKYFQEIDLNLSKSIMIFTYNDEEQISNILKDRMIKINVDGYSQKEKLIIAKNHLIKEIIVEYNIQESDIIFKDDILNYIIEKTSNEEKGVRNLKRSLNNIISWINMMRYVKIDNNNIIFPYNVSIEFFNKYCANDIKNNLSISKEKLHSLYL